MRLKTLPATGQAGGFAWAEAKRSGSRQYASAESETGGLSLSAGWERAGARRPSHPTANEAGEKRGHIVEPAPSPDDRESLDRLCFDTSVVGTNKPRCPGHWDNARGKIRLSKAADRLPSSGARIRVGTAGDLGAGQETSQGHALSSPLGERHETDPGEALRNRT